MLRNLTIGTAVLAFALFGSPGAGYSAQAPGLKLVGSFFNHFLW
jgi:hypothetical protein